LQIRDCAESSDRALAGDLGWAKGGTVVVPQSPADGGRYRITNHR
jgi:hypothetical protein